MFDNPFGQPSHDQRFARALGVPDDATFTTLNERAGSQVCEQLIRPRNLLDPSIEDHEVVDDLQQAPFFAQRDHSLLQRVLGLIPQVLNIN